MFFVLERKIKICDYWLWLLAENIYLDWRSHHKTNLCIPMCVPFVYPASHWSGAPLTWLTKDWQLRNSFLFRIFFSTWPGQTGQVMIMLIVKMMMTMRSRDIIRKRNENMWVCAHDDGDHDGQQQMHTKRHGFF